MYKLKGLYETKFITLPLFIVLFFCILFLQPQCCVGNDTLNVSQQLSVGQTLVSAEQTFELGFFKPGNSSRLYLGLWYRNIPEPKVWVANREIPITGDDLGANLAIGSDGNLRIKDGEQNTVWSSNASNKSNGTVAVLMDTGNFVLKDVISGLILWESFSCPVQTFLPTMRMGFNMKTGGQVLMSSWLTENDPSPGNFIVGLSEEIPAQAFIWNGSKPYWRGGPWNGWQFIGIPDSDKGYVNGINLEQNSQTANFTFYTYNSSYINIMVLTPTGSLNLMVWEEEINGWNVTWEAPEGPCDIYGFCGPFGVCNKNKSPVCECLRGYVPRHNEEWSKKNWSSGCVRHAELQCERNSSNLAASRSERDRFWKLSEIKLPDLYRYLYGLSFQDCEQWCLRNCSCVGYASPDGIGCMVWTTDLMDIQQFSFAGEDFYLRLANSEFGVKRRNPILIVGLTAVSGFILFSIFTYFLYHWKTRGKGEVTSFLNNLKCQTEWLTRILLLIFSIILVNRSYKTSIRTLGKTRKVPEGVLADTSGDASQETRWKHHELARESYELPMIDFARITAATRNFSDRNKLGAGGFGPVYKGELDDGQEIAVKRLSSHSCQGVKEFKNEIILISKLQHRNLVRLLGCSIKGEEKLLIYEYMKNKSLDAFVFDPRKKLQLSWAKRFNIILGIARGLLYLHRDSCLRVIHRDLKASNILLDDDMNPKISDFGLARAFEVTEELANTHRVVGTFGYMSPEYAMGGLFSEKSDLYSFCVLLLEIVSGRRNTMFYYHERSLNLLCYAWQLWNEGNTLALLDESLANACSPSEVMKCIHVGLLCVQDHAADRPTMSSAVLMLNGEKDLPHPKQPTFTFQSVLDSDPQSMKNTCAAYDITISMAEGR